MRRLPFAILKYPGAKPWFIEHAERFLRGRKTDTIVDPFFGGGSLTFTLLNRGYAKRAVLAEKDAEVRLFWESTRNDEGLAPRAEEW